MDDLTSHRRARMLALKVFDPIHWWVSQLEWQLTRLTSWLRDEA